MTEQPKRGSTQVTMNISLPTVLKHYVCGRAKDTHSSVSEYVRMLIRKDRELRRSEYVRMLIRKDRELRRALDAPARADHPRS